MITGIIVVINLQSMEFTMSTINHKRSNQYYNPNNIEYVYINDVLKELKLNKFVGWKLLIQAGKWTFDIEQKRVEIKLIPYIGKGIKIFRNHSVNMNDWKISKEAAQEFKKRYRSMNPYLKARVEQTNKNLNVYVSKIEESYDIMNRRFLADRVGERVAFAGEVVKLSIRETLDREHNVIVPMAIVTITNVITEHGEYIDHVNAAYTKDIYLKYCRNIVIGDKVRCVGTVTKYTGENKYGFNNVFINSIKK